MRFISLFGAANMIAALFSSLTSRFIDKGGQNYDVDSTALTTPDRGTLLYAGA